MENNNENTLPTCPDWSTAPDWANWFAIDENGDGMYYSDTPYKFYDCWRSYFGKDAYVKGLFDSSDWQNSLQKRPDNV